MKGLAEHFGWELRKTFSRPQAWAGFIVVTGFSVLFFALLQLNDVRPALYTFLKKFGALIDGEVSGLTLARSFAGQAVGVLVAVFVALVAGESVSREVDSGTIRLLLCRPVSRLRIVLMKFAAVAVYAFAMTLAASLVVLGAAVMFEGAGPMVVLFPETGGRVAYAPRDALFLYAWAVPFHSLSVMAVAVLAFFLSSCGARGATAAVVAAAYLFAEEFLRQMPFFAGIRQWFIMSHAGAWIRVFEPRDDWSRVWEAYIPLLIFETAVVLLAVLIFQRRDFKP